MIILDASALVDVVLDQPNQALVLEHFGQEIVAPAHQPVEALSAIARLRRAEVIAPDIAHAALRDVGSLRQELVLTDTSLMEAALRLDGRLRITDALYVALALRLACPLLTSDARLATADLPCEVILARR